MSLRSKVNKHLKRLEKPFTTFNEITVSCSALLHNFDFFSSLLPSDYVIPVLKSNAYGHGIAEVATILKQRKFPYIAVDGYYESLAIHDVSKQAVLVMGAIKPDNFQNMQFKGVTFVVQDIESVEALAKTGRKVKVHIELETGMTRHGVAVKDLPDFLKLLSLYPKLELEGVMTHLADADNHNDDSYNQRQTGAFDNAVSLILEANFKPKYIHIAQSAGSTKVTSKYANALRIGIALFGVSPLERRDAAHKQLSDLEPVLGLTSTITKVLAIERGTSVSYGRTFTADKDTKIGVLPLGYYEGLPRALSNIGTVQYKDSYLPIAGRICMNHTMIDLGNSRLKVGDKVVIISDNVKSKNTVDSICSAHDLFNYGLLVGLNQNIRRRIVD